MGIFLAELDQMKQCQEKKQVRFFQNLPKSWKIAETWVFISFKEWQFIYKDIISKQIISL